MSIDRTAWEKAIREAREARVQPSTAVSTGEFATLMELSREHAHRLLRELVEAGRAIRTKKQILRTDGGVQWVPAYEMIEPKREKKR